MMQASSDPNAAASQFRCDNCGGVLLYDPASRGLKCKHCKAAGNPAMLAGAGPGPREIPLSIGLTAAPRGLGTPAQAVQCNECGATVTLGPEERSGACIYCASPMVVTSPAGNQLITPESLVPFTVAQDVAAHSFGTWLKGLWFRPNDLGKLAKLEKINGVYVPYWTFDADVRSDWTAERGWNYQETEEYSTVENGETVYKTRTVTKTRWESAWGWREDSFDDVLVCGSKGVPPDLVDKLTTFQTTQLVPYSPAYLSGWRAEAYVVDLPAGWQLAQKKMADVQETRCGSDVGGDTHRALSVRTGFANETFKHVLLPVYVGAYRYGNKPYQVLINGQTGEVVGKAPYSIWKILAAVLVALAFVSIVGFLIMRSQEPAPSNKPTPTATGKPATPPPATPTPTKKK
jgi:DNA-directed RNA polymerase subunit RPC12/RpoP